MLYVDKTNNKVIGNTEERTGNQFTLKETTILPDANGYYNIDAVIKGQSGKMHFRLENGKILP